MSDPIWDVSVESGLSELHHGTGGLSATLVVNRLGRRRATQALVRGVSALSVLDARGDRDRDRDRDRLREHPCGLNPSAVRCLNLSVRLTFGCCLDISAPPRCQKEKSEMYFRSILVESSVRCLDLSLG